MSTNIKQIKVGSTLHDIDAKYLGGKSYDDIVSLVHGVIDTYVIPTSNSSKTGYSTVVERTEAQISTTTSTLNALTNQTDTNHIYKVGDIILMGATSDGTKNFDRWISAVNGDSITLDVLETQVAKHHHKINTVTGVTITASSKALTGTSTITSTTANVAKVGTKVDNVLIGTSGYVVTSVGYADNGSYSLKVETTDSSNQNATSHSHTVNSHNHTVTFNPSTIVSRNIEAYTVLSTSSHNQHKHSDNVSVAGAHTDSEAITYVNASKSGGDFIKTLKDSSSTSNTGGTTNLSTNVNTTALSTSAQESTDTIGDIVKTKSSGAHTHTVSTTTTDNVITSVNIPSGVITSVNLAHTKPSVQTTVVTGVTYASKTVVTSATLTGTTTFMDSCSVDASGVLSFSKASVGVSAPTTSVASISEVSTAGQSAGSTATLTYTSATQTYTSGKVTATGSAESAGAHQHGFSHTHTIPSHTHPIPSHTHTYYKTVASETGTAITGLNTTTYTPHTHVSKSVAGAQTSDGTITYVTGGDKTSVVRDLLNSNQSCTVGSASPGTSTVYHTISGTITSPALSVGSKSLSVTSILPAADSGEKAIKSITFTSKNFVTGVDVTTDDVKTGTNIGGE